MRLHTSNSGRSPCRRLSSWPGSAGAAKLVFSLFTSQVGFAHDADAAETAAVDARAEDAAVEAHAVGAQAAEIAAVGVHAVDAAVGAHVAVETHVEGTLAAEIAAVGAQAVDADAAEIAAEGAALVRIALATAFCSSLEPAAADALAEGDAVAIDAELARKAIATDWGPAAVDARAADAITREAERGGTGRKPDCDEVGETSAATGDAVRTPSARPRRIRGGALP